MIDRGQEREAEFVGGRAGLRFVVVVGADQRTIERLAGLEIIWAAIADGMISLPRCKVCWVDRAIRFRQPSLQRIPF